MKIEQQYPNKPNFGLVVALSVAVLLVLFVIAYFTVDWDGKHFAMKHHSAHPTSELVMPVASGAVRA